MKKKNLSRTVKILKINQTDPSSHCVSTSFQQWTEYIEFIDSIYSMNIIITLNTIVKTSS